MSATRQTGVAWERLRQERTRLLIAVGLVYFVSTALTSAADREMTKEYLTCLDKAGGVTSEMIACMGAERSVRTRVSTSSTAS
jgi:hypothetical protein